MLSRALLVDDREQCTWTPECTKKFGRNTDFYTSDFFYKFQLYDKTFHFMTNYFTPHTQGKTWAMGNTRRTQWSVYFDNRENRSLSTTHTHTHYITLFVLVMSSPESYSGETRTSSTAWHFTVVSRFIFLRYCFCPTFVLDIFNLWTCLFVYICWFCCISFCYMSCFIGFCKYLIREGLNTYTEKPRSLCSSGHMRWQRGLDWFKVAANVSSMKPQPCARDLTYFGTWVSSNL